jgi:hypothetical protein
MTVSWNPRDGGYGASAPARPSVDARRLWAGGLAAAVVAALAALVGLLMVRGLFTVDFLAPARAGMWGDSTTVWLVLAAGGGALLATALLHVLLLAAPEPLLFFRWNVGLLTLCLTVWPFVTRPPY